MRLCGSKHIWYNLKCNPERAIELREKYEDIKPGYHMNKTHWNAVPVNNNLTDTLVIKLIDHSYDLVYIVYQNQLETHKWSLLSKF